MSKLFTTTTLFFLTLFGFYTASIWPVSISEEIISSAFIEHQVTQLTGMLTLGYLSIVMLLSVKPKWLINRFFKAGDMYKAHREFGIASGVSLISHWLLANDVTLTQWLFEGWIQDAGEELGEVVLYLLLPFVAVSLSRVFKLRWFKHIHHLGGVIFLIAAIHSVAMLESGTAQLLFSSAIFAFTLIGGVCAYISLSKRAQPSLVALFHKMKSMTWPNWKVFNLVRSGSINNKG